MADIDNDSDEQDFEGSVRVPVNIQTGSMGRGGNKWYAPIAALHDQTRDLEVDMTWEEAIRLEFQLVLDPNRYFLRKHEPSANRHRLDSRISELLAEFTAEPEGDWKVTIIDARLQKGGINGNKTSPVEANKRKSQSRLELASPHKKGKVEQSRGPYRGEVQSHSSSSALKVTQYRPQDNREYRHPRQSPVPSREDVQRDAVDNEDDDDAHSLHSQDSQVEDLIELGIPEEDIKSTFLRRIQKSLDGDMLLKAQSELRKQKATSSDPTKRDKWTKWALTCPYPVSILRTLFDV